MKIHRIQAVVLRHLYNYRHSWDRLVDSFYWPAMDILIWGLTSAWIRGQADIPNLVLILLSGLVFWQIVWRSQYEFTVNILEEMWNQNLVSLFASPLRVGEWIAAAIILGFIKMTASVLFAGWLTFVVYSVRLWDGGWQLIPAMALLLANGWWIGLFVSGLIVRFGTRIQTLAWSGIYLLAPFSAIYYPLSALPEWAQKVSWWIPMSHVFGYMRSSLMSGSANLIDLVTPLLLTLIYIGVAIVWFNKSMDASRKIGLSRLE